MVPSDVLVVLVVEVGVGGEIPSQSLDIFTSAQFLQSENEVCFANGKTLNDKNECISSYQNCSAAFVTVSGIEKKKD